MSITGSHCQLLDKQHYYFLHKLWPGGSRVEEMNNTKCQFGCGYKNEFTLVLQHEFVCYKRPYRCIWEDCKQSFNLYDLIQAIDEKKDPRIVEIVAELPKFKDHDEEGEEKEEKKRHERNSILPILLSHLFPDRSPPIRLPPRSTASTGAGGGASAPPSSPFDRFRLLFLKYIAKAQYAHEFATKDEFDYFWLRLLTWGFHYHLRIHCQHKIPCGRCSESFMVRDYYQHTEKHSFTEKAIKHFKMNLQQFPIDESVLHHLSMLVLHWVKPSQDPARLRDSVMKFSPNSSQLMEIAAAPPNVMSESAGGVRSTMPMGTVVGPEHAQRYPDKDTILCPYDDDVDTIFS
jgi:hypothetical protein